MKDLSIQEIIKATDGKLFLENEKVSISSVSTDSRNVGESDIFFAIIGDKFDGHNFIAEVINKGCRVLVVSKENLIPNESPASFILVNDTLTAYQNLAKYYKELISPITIGITGSVGKTSLKDMVNVISEDYYNTVCSVENENNHMGVPKTIFRMEENTEVLILEMGMNHAGEIDVLANIGRPNIAAITNVGVSHIENFSSQDDIFKSKMEITNYFSDDNALVVMGDDPYLKRVKENSSFEVISAGVDEGNDFVAIDTKYLDDTHITFLIEYDKGVERFTLPIAGLYNSTTAALAIAIMSKLNISVVNCVHSLTKLTITPHRVQLINSNGYKIIDDTYNASPISMKSALEYLMAIECERKIAVLADMKELGDIEEKLHKDLGYSVANNNIDYLFTVGRLGKLIGDAAAEKMGQARVFSFEDNESCTKELKNIINKGDGILVKGSNSMKMKEIVNSLV